MTHRYATCNSGIVAYDVNLSNILKLYNSVQNNKHFKK